MEENNCQQNRQYELTFKQLWQKNLCLRLLLLAFAVVIPSNIALQARSLRADTPSISLDKNVIYVNPKQGDDSQAGKELSPLKTITQALKIATAGSTIQLASGTYSEATGEKFPFDCRRWRYFKRRSEQPRIQNHY